jgi:UDP-N-acetyl-D-glucosamine/UDP-N-acetyl-D-galactosamine dehydrogenase
MKSNYKIGIIGLGYVGLPLAVEFSKKYQVIAFDISESRIKELKNGYDSTLEVESSELEKAPYISFTFNESEIACCNVFIITVPTPIDEKRKPNLKPLTSASKTVGKVLKGGDIVIYESTVYPGATEEVCVPILENESSLRYISSSKAITPEKQNQNVVNGFYCGYSPERINPGDKEHRLTDIKKITSGSTLEIATIIDSLYKEIITAGTHKTTNIKVAEAAKVIENTQRDVNIALINELALIFHKLDIDTESVLEAAGTKWNFLPFKPGLVGGHCIGVDPYYLTHKAIEVGHTPEIILAGRKINDYMGTYVAKQVIDLMIRKDISISNSNILIMGLAFKENCPDIRNTRVIDLVNYFDDSNCSVDVYDPWVDKSKSISEYNIQLIKYPENNKYDAIIVAVSHKEFRQISLDTIKKFGKIKHVLYDIKHILNANDVDARL